MKAGNCSRMWRPAAGAMLVGALAFAVSAQGGPRVADGSARNRTKSDTARQVTGPQDHLQSVVAGAGATMEILLTPVADHPTGSYNTGGAYGNANISGQTLTVDAGGFRSYWNVQMRNWDEGFVGPNADDGRDDIELRNWQGRVDAMGYMSGDGGDLTPASVPCVIGPDCNTALGEGGASCSGGFCAYGWINRTRGGVCDGGTFMCDGGPLNGKLCAINNDCGDGFVRHDPFSCGEPTWDLSLVSATGPLYFGSQDPEQPGSGFYCGTRDFGHTIYGGSLALDVPADAKGVYTLPWVAAETFATQGDPVATPIPLAAAVAGVLEITTGSCCTNLGPTTSVCTDDVTVDECNALPTTNTSVFRPDDTCAEACPSCITNTDCNDFDACTNDVCTDFVCSNNPIAAWDTATQCCNASNGNVTTPVDANVCSNAECSIPPNRGEAVQVAVADGDPCKGVGDDNPCTFDDTCDGLGQEDSCSGTDVNASMIACTVDADCQAATGLTAPTCVSGTCECSLVPDLTIDIDPSGKADDNCFDSGDEGDKIVATVNVAAATAPVNGGQFLITYDPSCMDFNSVVGVAPYTDQVFGPVVDEAAGTIFTVVGVGFGVGDGPAGNASMLELSFTKIGDCNSCQICFGGNNPQNTYLVDNTGQQIGVNPICSKAVTANNEVAIDVPDNVKRNVDCDQPTATVSWDPPTVTDSCGTSTLTCTGEHQSGQSFDDRAMNGGVLPPGFTNFCCTSSSDWCDKSAENCWTVEVNDQVGLDIEIALSPTQQSKPEADLTRCIKFTLYPNTIQEPFRFEDNVTFGGEFEFIGKSKDALKIPNIGNWDCITAWDQLHTLRSCYLFAGDDCVDGRLHASFTGDPAFGGNWLIGGNLDGWKKDVAGSNPSLFVIDVLDYGTFTSQWGVDYGTGDTPCGTAGPHADINGDGLVDLADYAFIQANFLVSAKECCGYCVEVDPDTGECKEGLPAGAAPVGITEISVRELREMGLGDLAAGDVNGDGLLNVEDMNAFGQGARPEGKATRGVRKGSGTR